MLSTYLIRITTLYILTLIFTYYIIFSIQKWKRAFRNLLSCHISNSKTLNSLKNVLVLLWYSRDWRWCSAILWILRTKYSWFDRYPLLLCIFTSVIIFLLIYSVCIISCLQKSRNCYLGRLVQFLATLSCFRLSRV